VIVNVPVQYYQSVIAIETAVTGVLLFQIRFFEQHPRAVDDLTDGNPGVAVPWRPTRLPLLCGPGESPILSPPGFRFRVGLFGSRFN
jgi:hypothetical protein